MALRNRTQIRRVVLVGGSVRAAAADAIRAGLKVVAVDRFGDRDLRELCERWIEYDSEGRWASVVAQLPPSPTIPLNGFSRQLSHENPMAWEALRSRLIAYPSDEVADLLNLPSWLQEIALRSSVRFPEIGRAHV